MGGVTPAKGNWVLATYRIEHKGRWSNQRRRHRVTSIDPVKGVEGSYWGRPPKYVEGQEHLLSTDGLRIIRGIAPAPDSLRD